MTKMSRCSAYCLTSSSVAGRRNKTGFRYVLPLVFVVFTGCGSNEQQGTKDSREEFMTEFKKELSEKKIPYNEVDGYVMYSKSHKDVVERIKRDINERLTAEVGTSFGDERSTRYFRKLLDKKGIPYREIRRGNADWTFWTPKSVKEQEELELEVVMQPFGGKEPCRAQ